MANTTVNVDIQVQSKTLGQLEDQLTEINDELRKVEVGSQAFQDLTRESQLLNRELEKVNEEIKGFTLEDSIQQADGAIKILGGSLSTVVGTLGIFGVESEAFGEFEKKAASAIAVTVGLKDATEGFGKVFPKTMAKAVTSVKTFGASANKALIATGIGAFVVVLGAVIANWDAIVKGVKNLIASSAGLSKFFDGLKAGFNAVFESIRPVLEFFGLYPTLEEQAAESIRKTAEQSVPVIEKEIELLKARGATAEEVYQKEKELLEQKIAAAETEEEQMEASHALAVLIATEEKRLEDEARERRKLASEERVANEQEALNILQTLKDAELDFLAQTDEDRLELEYQRTLAEIDNLKVSEEQKAEIKKQAEINFNNEVNAIKEAQALVEKEELQAKNDELLDILQQYSLASIEDVFERAKEELRIEEEKEVARLRSLGATEEQILAIKKFYANESAKITGEQTQWDMMNAEMRRDFVIAAAAQTFANVASIAGENSKVGKAAAIAATIIDTYQSATASYKALAGIPIVGPALGAVAAAAAVAAGIENVKRIKQQDVNQVSSGNVSGASPSFGSTTPVASPPQTVQQQFQQEALLAQTPQITDVQPTVRAYVLSGDVTTAQEADARLSNKRTLAG